MKKLIALSILAFCCALSLDAQQQVQQGNFAKYTSMVQKTGDQVSLTIDADMHGTRLRGQQMLQIVPVLHSNDGTHNIEFAPVAVAGPRRYKMTKRMMDFGKHQFDPEPMTFAKFKNRKGADFLFVETVPYEAWMRDAKLSVNEVLGGCPKCDLVSNPLVAYEPALPPPFVPQYHIAYVTPPAEQEKRRSETHVSYINYEVGKAVILPEFKNNAQMLSEVSKIMTELNTDKDLTVNNIKVTGYASPDGNFNSNLTLSQKRAEAFLTYLQTHYGVNVSSVYSEGRGEDWAGLRKAVESSSLADKAQVLSLIDNTPDVAKRKAAIKALSGGHTYRTLLAEYFPPLRRNEYEVSYIARAFNVEEAKTIINTRPQLLSLNEMFLVANSYPKDSKEFKQVFDVASRMYPADAYANLNSGALEVEIGAYDVAIERLQDLAAPEALNNLGVAYAKKGDAAKAAEYFRRAAAAGNTDGSYNLDQLQKFLNN